MKTIKFAGLIGKVKETSPHGNYLVVKLSDRVTICGTFSNQWNWDESHDLDSGFVSFITYVGIKENELSEISNLVKNLGGYFKANEDKPRKAKRVTGFPKELKIRGLHPDYIGEFVNYGEA
ncbi:MAG: hypothetical protein VKL41_21245 [Snowella sp.]|nr:hypothetical protein [Snowella sp.]